MEFKGWGKCSRQHLEHSGGEHPRSLTPLRGFLSSSSLSAGLLEHAPLQPDWNVSAACLALRTVGTHRGPLPAVCAARCRHDDRHDAKHRSGASDYVHPHELQREKEQKREKEEQAAAAAAAPEAAAPLQDGAPEGQQQQDGAGAGGQEGGEGQEPEDEELAEIRKREAALFAVSGPGRLPFLVGLEGFLFVAWPADCGVFCLGWLGSWGMRAALVGASPGDLLC